VEQKPLKNNGIIFKLIVMIAEEMKCGGWTNYRVPITKEDQAVFDEAMEGFVGVHYIPVAVSTQVVAGVNYKFFCISKVVAPGTTPGTALVSIFKPLEGKAVITSIN